MIYYASIWQVDFRIVIVNWICVIGVTTDILDIIYVLLWGRLFVDTVLVLGHKIITWRNPQLVSFYIEMWEKSRLFNNQFLTQSLWFFLFFVTSNTKPTKAAIYSCVCRWRHAYKWANRQACIYVCFLYGTRYACKFCMHI